MGLLLSHNTIIIVIYIIKDYRTGKNKYLTKSKNTVTEDLWECVSAASDKPVVMVMSKWNKKMEWPVKQVCISVIIFKPGARLVS